MISGLTIIQANCFAFIERYAAQTNGASPSYKEIALGVGINSVSRVREVLDGLEERGLIKRLRNRARAIIILPQNVCAHCGFIVGSENCTRAAAERPIKTYSRTPAEARP